MVCPKPRTVSSKTTTEELKTVPPEKSLFKRRLSDTGPSLRPKTSNPRLRSKSVDLRPKTATLKSTNLRTQSSDKISAIDTNNVQSPTNGNFLKEVKSRVKSAPCARRRELVEQRREELVRLRLEELGECVRTKHRHAKTAWLAQQKRSHHQVIIQEVVTTKREGTPYEAFRRIGRVVLTLTRIYVYLRAQRFEVDDLFDQKKKKSPKKEGEEVSGYEDLAFDVSYYRANPEYTWPDYAMDAVKRPPSVRSEEDCRIIRDAMRTLPSYRKYTEDMQQLISRVVEYTKCGKNRVIVRKGHQGHCFYFIFSGTLHVVFDKEEASVFTRPEVSTLHKGDVFGEVALLKDTRRNATVVSASESELLLIDKTAFKDYGLYHLFMEKCQFAIGFLSHLDICRTWRAESVEELSFVSRTESYQYKKVVERDVRTTNWIYVITKGSCEVLRLIDLTQSSDFARLVPGEEVEALRNTFDAVFFDLKTLHEFVTMMQAREAARRKTMYRERLALSPSMLTNFSSGSINTESQNSLDQYSRKHKTSGPILLAKGPSEILHMSGKRTAACPKRRKPKVCYESEAREKIHNRARTGDRRMALVPGLHVDKFSGIGAFLKVDTLGSGDIFGLHTPESNAINGPLALISQGAELIRIPASQFRALSDDATRKATEKLMKIYPSEQDLCTRVFKMAEWNMFRSELGDCVRARSRGSTTPSKNYFRRSESMQSEVSPMAGGLPRVPYTHGAMPRGDGSLPRSPPRLRHKSALPADRHPLTDDLRPKTAGPRIQASSSTLA